jgi:hypothetical protein
MEVSGTLHRIYDGLSVFEVSHLPGSGDTSAAWIKILSQKAAEMSERSRFRSAARCATFISTARLT